MFPEGETTGSGQAGSRGVSRRELFRDGGLLAATGLVKGGSPLSAAAPPLKLSYGPKVYESMGVRPIINCKHVITQLGGSLVLPEVTEAMASAAHHFVQLDELMEAVGKRIAELTGAESAIVTAGCAASLTHATSACIAGADPEKMQRLPDLTGLKDEVIAPLYSRNRYDHAVRMLGVRMVEVGNMDQLEAAFGPRTAMVYVMGGPNDSGPFGLKVVAEAARRRGVPVVVDAAAEELMLPNVHLERGADLVAYSGGKVIRGPQCAGLLLGRKDLVQAAWLNGAPHHSFGRPMKVGKEEIVGMLAAVEMWFKRDHPAEWKQWESWVEHISNRVAKAAGVTTEVERPKTLTGRTPVLVVSWDGAKLGITGEEVERLLFETEPRIALAGSTGSRDEFLSGLGSAASSNPAASSVTIRPIMMAPGEEKIVAERLYAVLSRPPQAGAPSPGGPAARVAGEWDVRIEFVCGGASHAFFIEQQGGELAGRHKGDTMEGDLRGRVIGNEIRFRSAFSRYQGMVLRYEFAGKVEGDAMQGTVDLGEYGEARWSARKHSYVEPRQLIRPLRNS